MPMRDDQQPGAPPGGGDQINAQGSQGFINQPTGPVMQHFETHHHGLSAHDREQRRRMRALVREFWIAGVLDQSLYREAWSALGLYRDPAAITYAGQLARKKGDREPEPLPADTTIAQVFRAAHSQLLILGAPGAGKTTLLLELARSLLDAAEQDERLAIPVVFNLSSWAQQRQPLGKWLVQELRDTYGVGKDLARQWVEQRAILPLLDGLDEVAEPHRAACVAAINTFRGEKGLEGLVVCSRLADYRAIGAKLELDEAVVVQPLDDAQLASYFDRAGAPLAGVRAVLAEDAELLKLARVPLLLNIVSLAYQGERPEELRAVPPAEQRRRLFDRYVAQMLERPRKPEQLEPAPPYPHEQTRHWLRWLAGRLHENNLTVFQIELMQPWWLGRWWQRALYVVGAALFTGAGGAVLGPLFGALLGLVFGLGLEGLIWLFPETFAMSASSGLSSPGDGLGFGLGGGLWGGLGGGMVGGLGSALGSGLGQLSPLQRRVWHAPAAGLLVAGLMVLFWWTWDTPESILLFLAAVSAAPMGMTTAALVQRGEVRSTEALSWSLPVEDIRWYLGLVIVLVVVLVFRWDLKPLVGGTIVALAISLALELTSAEAKDKTDPNEGIWRSLRHALAIWLGFGLGFGLVFVFAIGLAVALDIGLVVELAIGLHRGLAIGLLFGLYSGLAASLYFGGLAFVQHWVLRLVCTLAGYTPWRYVRFLEYAKERILLRRVGGSYIFVHRMLLEYFAEEPPQ